MNPNPSRPPSLEEPPVAIPSRAGDPARAVAAALGTRACQPIACREKEIAFEFPSTGSLVPAGHSLILAIDHDPQVVALYRRYLAHPKLFHYLAHQPGRSRERGTRAQPFAITLDVAMGAKTITTSTDARPAAVLAQAGSGPYDFLGAERVESAENSQERSQEARISRSSSARYRQTMNKATTWGPPITCSSRSWKTTCSKRSNASNLMKPDKL